MKTAYFNRFCIDLPDEAVTDCYHRGRCDDDVEFWHKRLDLSHIPSEDLTAELREYGAWNDVELSNREENELRIIWIAAGNIQEETE